MKLFLEDCTAVIKTIEEENVGTPIDLLLWVYLNLLCYPMINQRDEGYKAAFLQLIGESNNFSALWGLSNNISQTSYTIVIKEILQCYTYIQGSGEDLEPLSVKSLESIYERLLHQQLRSKTGSYYTPDYIVEYITAKSIEAYFKNSFGLRLALDSDAEAIIEINRRDATEILKIIDNIKIADIACGGGAFLRSALRMLCNIKKAALAAMDLQQEESTIKAGIARNNIYGMDIQPSTVLLCKILLLMTLGTNPGSSINEDLNIIVGNSLLIEKDSCYDIVLGNPPYLGERGNKEFFKALRETAFGSRYYESKMDYFYYFIYKAAELLKEKGVLGYITTNYFVTADGAFQLRQFLRENLSFKTIVNFNDVSIFQDAKGQHNMLYIALKGGSEADGGTLLCLESGSYKQKEIEEILKGKGAVESVKAVYYEGQSDLYDPSGQMLIQSEGNHTAILQKILSAATATLGSLCYINQGLVSGADRITAALKEKLESEIEIGRGIFVLTEEEAEEKGFLTPEYEVFLKPFYKNSNVYKYNAKNIPQLYILYITDRNVKKINDYPLLLEHLLPYKTILEARREVVQGSISWYSLQWPRNIMIFTEEKILAPQRSLENIFGYSRGDWFASADVYFISLKQPQVSINYLLGLLNSPVVYFWLYYRGKRKGDYLELYSTPLRAIPVPTYCTAEIAEIDLLVQKIRDGIEAGLDYGYLQEKINELVYKIYDLSPEEVQEIISHVEKRRKR